MQVEISFLGYQNMSQSWNVILGCMFWWWCFYRLYRSKSPFLKPPFWENIFWNFVPRSKSRKSKHEMVLLMAGQPTSAPRTKASWRAHWPLVSINISLKKVVRGGRLTSHDLNSPNMDSAALGGTSSLAGSCYWAFVFLDGEFLKFNMEIPENQPLEKDILFWSSSCLFIFRTLVCLISWNWWQCWRCLPASFLGNLAYVHG